jgi:hypothetical protein
MLTPSQIADLITGCKLHCRPWWGTVKAFEAAALTETADMLHANRSMITARHKIVNTGHPRIKELNKLKKTCTDLWHLRTMDYVESGVRLVVRDRFDAISAELQNEIDKLPYLIEKLDEARYDIIEEARGRLGDLFCEGDYPKSWADLFGIEFRLVSIEPPSYLMRVSPKAYQAELDKMLADVRTASAEFTSQCYQELGTMVEQLVEVLKPGPDGTRKRFHGSRLSNLLEFFDRAQALNIAEDPQMTDLISRAKEIVGGLNINDLRHAGGLRETVAAELEVLRRAIPQAVQEGPRRVITPVREMEPVEHE